ncbi:MAG TPA: biotin/lipoyl-binding protein [Vicinamibacterales bacterium]|nr:biotin/lipoyl-binding protein [Vicinamibacterales bacterium]
MATPARIHWFWLAALVVLVIGLIFTWRRHTVAASGAGSDAAHAPSIPVSAAKRTQATSTCTTRGWAAVAPLATVTVRSRVDGQLMSVNYKESALVYGGDLLLEIEDLTLLSVTRRSRAIAPSISRRHYEADVRTCPASSLGPNCCRQRRVSSLDSPDTSINGAEPSLQV